MLAKIEYNCTNANTRILVPMHRSGVSHANHSPSPLELELSINTDEYKEFLLEYCDEVKTHLPFSISPAERQSSIETITKIVARIGKALHRKQLGFDIKSELCEQEIVEHGNGLREIFRLNEKEYSKIVIAAFRILHTLRYQRDQDLGLPIHDLIEVTLANVLDSIE